MPRSRWLAPTFAAGLALGACRQDDPNHCLNNGGDAYCQEKTGLAEGQVFCTNNCGGEYDASGCLVADVPPAAECWACTGEDSQNCDGVADTGSETASETATDTGTTSETADTSTSETGPNPCEGSQDCTDPEQPFCAMTGDCVACDGMPDPDAACVGADPALPVCVASNCVACAEGKTDACTETTPICNTATNECEGCTNHDQCAGTACNFDAGNCIDASAVVHVDGDFQNCGASNGSEAMPYCTVGAALAGAGAETLVILHERDGQSSYQEANTVTLTVAIFAADGEDPILQGFNNNPALTVSPTGNLMLLGIKVSNGPDYGIEINGGNSWIEASKIVANTNSGIRVSNGFTAIINSFVGVSIPDVPGMSVGAGTVSIVYSSIIGGTVASPALFCEQGDGVTIRNSLVVSRDGGPELDCVGAQATKSAFEADVPGGNTSLGVMADGMWFLGYNTGDFRLSPAAPLALSTAAIWTSGDPTVDIEGAARPTVDGTADYAGADIAN